MKRKIIVLLILCSISKIQSQNSQIKRLTKIKEKLIIDKKIINDSIEKLDIKINLIKSQKNKSNTLSGKFIKTTTKMDAPIKDKPSLFGKVIGNIPKGKSIEVYYFHNGNWSVKYDSIIGYVSDMFINNRIELNKRRKNGNNEEIISKYGTEIGNKILNKRFWIGMTSGMATESLGSPSDINRTTGSWGFYEQWIYDKGNLYLYFENGKLASYQN